MRKIVPKSEHDFSQIQDFGARGYIIRIRSDPSFLRTNNATEATASNK